MVRMIQHSITVKLTDIRDPTAADLGDKLMRCLRARQCPETVHCLQAATILDPRFKILGFGNPDKAKDALKYVTAECAKLMRRNYLY